MMSSGGSPTSRVSRSYARRQTTVLRSNVSAWPSSSKAMTTTAAPYLRHSRACARNASSPSLREIEFTMALPCRHFRPASITSHLEESTMTGTRLK